MTTTAVCTMFFAQKTLPVARCLHKIIDKKVHGAALGCFKAFVHWFLMTFSCFYPSYKSFYKQNVAFLKIKRQRKHEVDNQRLHYYESGRLLDQTNEKAFYAQDYTVYLGQYEVDFVNKKGEVCPRRDNTKGAILTIRNNKNHPSSPFIRDPAATSKPEYMTIERKSYLYEEPTSWWVIETNQMYTRGDENDNPVFIAYELLKEDPLFTKLDLGYHKFFSF